MPSISLSKADLDYEMDVTHVTNVYIYPYWTLFKITCENSYAECHFYMRILSWCGNSLDHCVIILTTLLQRHFFSASAAVTKQRKTIFFYICPCVFVCLFVFSHWKEFLPHTHTLPLGQVRESPAVPIYSSVKHLYS